MRLEGCAWGTEGGAGCGAGAAAGACFVTDFGAGDPGACAADSTAAAKANTAPTIAKGLLRTAPLVDFYL